MFPIKDDNPTETKPYITCILISLNILIFFYQMGLEENARVSLIFNYGFKSSHFFSYNNQLNSEVSPLFW